MPGRRERASKTRLTLFTHTPLTSPAISHSQLHGSLKNPVIGAQEEEEKVGPRKPAVCPSFLLCLVTLMQGVCPESQGAAVLLFRVPVLSPVLLLAQARESQ